MCDPADFDNPDKPLTALFARWPDIVTEFFDRQMLCPGCPVAPYYTIRDACEKYGLDEAAFRAALRERAGL